MSAENVEIVPGLTLRGAVGVDTATVMEGFLVLKDRIPSRVLSAIVSEYNRWLHKCEKCDTAFAYEYKNPTTDIPHWYRGKFQGNRMRGRPPGPILDDVWPNGKGKYSVQLCSDCVFGHIPGILTHFSGLPNSVQVRALRALSDTAAAYANPSPPWNTSSRWQENNILFHRFFTKLTQELIPIIRKRGKRQSHYLTSMMVSCNLIPKEE